MKHYFAKAAFLSASFGLMMMSAQAATIINAGDETVTLVVTESGEQTELNIAAAETIEFCLAGCFVTFPNGDRQALTGSETVEINAANVLVR